MKSQPLFEALAVLVVVLLIAAVLWFAGTLVPVIGYLAQQPKDWRAQMRLGLVDGELGNWDGRSGVGVASDRGAASGSAARELDGFILNRLALLRT